MQIGPSFGTDSIVSALKQAAATTGSDFHYLLGTAMRESSLKPQAQSATSSATGLFQFVEQTWLGLIKSHGAQYGLSSMAGAISVDGNGHYHVTNPQDRQAILDLRKNPQISALMAGEYTKASAQSMQASLGRAVCGGELYAAHFLGPDAACKLIRLKDSAPGTNAATLLPAAAAANKDVFFHADGSAKNVREVYDWAMQQPGADMPVRTEQMPVAAAVAPGSLVEAAGIHHAASAPSANIQALLASLMNWQPSHDFFAPNAQTPVSPLALTPGLLNLLSES
jgi:hypothetical protein